MAMPDVRIVVELWTSDNIRVVMTEYDPKGTAILVNSDHHKKD